MEILFWEKTRDKMEKLEIDGGRFTNLKGFYEEELINCGCNNQEFTFFWIMNKDE